MQLHSARYGSGFAAPQNSSGGSGSAFASQKIGSSGSGFQFRFRSWAIIAPIETPCILHPAPLKVPLSCEPLSAPPHPVAPAPPPCTVKSWSSQPKSRDSHRKIASESYRRDSNHWRSLAVMSLPKTQTMVRRDLRSLCGDSNCAIDVPTCNIRSTWNCRIAREGWPRSLNASDWRLAILPIWIFPRHLEHHVTIRTYNVCLVESSLDW